MIRFDFDILIIIAQAKTTTTTRFFASGKRRHFPGLDAIENRSVCRQIFALNLPIFFFAFLPAKVCWSWRTLIEIEC